MLTRPFLYKALVDAKSSYDFIRNATEINLIIINLLINIKFLIKCSTATFIVASYVKTWQNKKALLIAFKCMRRKYFRDTVFIFMSKYIK